MAATRVARRRLPAALGRTALGAGAASAVTHAAPVAQATSERLALTVAALIAVAVLAVLGGLVVLLFRRQAQAEDDAVLAAEPPSAGSGESLWSTPHVNGSSAGSVRAGAEDDEDLPDDDDLGADPAGAADDATPMDPLVLPPDPQEPWTAEITWVAHKTRFRVVAHRGGDPEGAPVALAQTEALPWPPKDDASVQALAEASGTLESVLLDSGWTALAGGATWYSKRFAWEPQPAAGDADGDGDPGRFEREAVAQDADAPHR